MVLPMDDNVIAEAYSHTDFDVAETGSGLEVPVSEAAQFTPSEPIDPNTVHSVMDKQGYAFIAPVTKSNYLSSKVLDSETNEFFHIKVFKNRINVYPKGDEFSLETLSRVVTCITTHVTDLSLYTD